ncbi:nif11-like leader peptide domain protein [Synechococcus sp. MEDNS5]|uniref:Nif11-like leader peptide family natural product precursor n=1 Tax=Synechococcus sp. MEDNS5 TaxID=1442554 RepID=UPI0016461B86|nr:Nif11-like leader peptide family natural product precursor [Synechococcus sp. MEDNS5]QNJ07376.1 nif11-like leader peptide domain protein [Synechococcus sp. MEDNS5]
MSEEQLKAFLEAVKADSSLQEKLKAAGDVDAVVAIAKAAGFAISADDLERAQSEISEEELEGVAGGYGHPETTMPADPTKLLPIKINYGDLLPKTLPLL